MAWGRALSCVQMMLLSKVKSQVIFIPIDV
jgi:hypothetical protein